MKFWKASCHGLLLAAWIGYLSSSAQAQHQQHGASMAASAATAVKINLVSTAGFAPDGSLWLLNLNPQGKLRLLKSPDQGRSWGHERVLELGDDKPNPSGEAPAMLAFGPQGQVLIGYPQSLGKRFTGEVRLIRSVDGGVSFSAPITVHQDRQIIGHSFPVMRFDAQGVLHLVWLDGRDKAQVAAQEGLNEKGKSSYRGSAVYRVVSRDAGASFSADLKLADHSCECCRIATTLDQQGQLALMWRHVFAPNLRDHAFARVKADSGVIAEPTRATFDNWQVDACPHHGGAIAPAAQQGFHALWFGARQNEFAVRYGRLDQVGKPVGAASALPDEAAEHADLQSVGQRVVIIWRSYDGQQTHVKAWISDDDGQTFKLRELAQSSEENDYPRLITKPAGKAGEAAQIFWLWNTKAKLYVDKI